MLGLHCAAAAAVVFACVLSEAACGPVPQGFFDDFQKEEKRAIDRFSTRLVRNPRIRKNYINCFLDNGPCSPEAKNLKRMVPDAIQNDCELCTEIQKKVIEKMMCFMNNSQPEILKQVAAKFDPNGDYMKNYLSKLEKDTFSNSQLDVPLRNPFEPQLQDVEHNQHLPGQNPLHNGQNPLHPGQNPLHNGQNPLHNGQDPLHQGQNPLHPVQNQKLPDNHQPPHLPPHQPPHQHQQQPHQHQQPPHQPQKNQQLPNHHQQHPQQIQPPPHQHQEQAHGNHQLPHELQQEPPAHNQQQQQHHHQQHPQQNQQQPHNHHHPQQIQQQPEAH